MEVIVFSQSSCSFCTKQKEFLEEQGIRFEERDILENDLFYKQFIDLGGKGTPFTIKKQNGQITAIINGFDREKLLTELN